MQLVRRKIKGKILSLGKEKPFQFDVKEHYFSLEKLYAHNEHIGAKLEIKR